MLTRKQIASPAQGCRPQQFLTPAELKLRGCLFQHPRAQPTGLSPCPFSDCAENRYLPLPRVCCLLSPLPQPVGMIHGRGEAWGKTGGLLAPSCQLHPVCQGAFPRACFLLGFSSPGSLPFSSFTFIKRLFSSSSLSFVRLRLLIFSPGSLDSSLCSIQPGISHDVLCM